MVVELQRWRYVNRQELSAHVRESWYLHGPADRHERCREQHDGKYYITVRNPAPSVANFTATPTSGIRPLSVMFNDTSANAPASWLWIFGDGTNATIQHPVHPYTSTGNYTVSLNVTNGDGASAAIKEKYISVFNPPPTTIPTTTATTTVTTKPITTKPTPTKTHAPLSPMVAVAGITLVGLLYVIGKKKAP